MLQGTTQRRNLALEVENHFHTHIILSKLAIPKLFETNDYKSSLCRAMPPINGETRKFIAFNNMLNSRFCQMYAPSAYLKLASLLKLLSHGLPCLKKVHPPFCLLFMLSYC